MEKLVPKLRFPDFEGNWEKKRISDILKIGSGRDYKHLEKGKIPVYGTGGLMTYVDDFLYDGDSVCIGRKGTIDKPRFLEGKFWTVDTLFYTHSFNNSFPKFIFSIFNRINWNLYNEASGVPSLSKSTIEKIEINIPNLEEQQKIASFLTSVDERITLLERQKQGLETYKKGVMQQIFSQQLRFKDDKGKDFPDWEEKKLGEVCEKKSSNISANSLENNSGTYKIYGATGFLQFVDFFQEEKEYISIVKDGAGVGRTLLCEPKSSVLGTLDKISPKLKIDIYFLFITLNNIDFTKYSIGSTIPHIYFKDYSKEKIKLPCLEEQQKIATFLSEIDIRIEVVSKQIEKSKVFKKGLLQQMFV